MKQHGIIIVADVGEAMVALGKLGRGDKVRSHSSNLYNNVVGLLSDELVS